MFKTLLCLPEANAWQDTKRAHVIPHLIKAIALNSWFPNPVKLQKHPISA